MMVTGQGFLKAEARMNFFTLFCQSAAPGLNVSSQKGHQSIGAASRWVSTALSQPDVTALGHQPGDFKPRSPKGQLPVMAGTLGRSPPLLDGRCERLLRRLVNTSADDISPGRV